MPQTHTHTWTKKPHHDLQLSCYISTKSAVCLGVFVCLVAFFSFLFFRGRVWFKAAFFWEYDGCLLNFISQNRGCRGWSDDRTKRKEVTEHQAYNLAEWTRKQCIHEEEKLGKWTFFEKRITSNRAISLQKCHYCNIYINGQHHMPWWKTILSRFSFFCSFTSFTLLF